MPGLAAQTERAVRVSTPTARIARFTLTERLAHWLLAVSFFVMLGSGLLLSEYLPGVIDRPTAKAWHLWSALALPIGVVVLMVIGNRKSLMKSAAEIDRFDRDDAQFLSPARIAARKPTPPQGRFNGGQKINTILTFGLLAVMFLTGFFLWYGEQDTRFRFAGTIYIHDWLTYALIILVGGHLYMAMLNPKTRHSLRGMAIGDVDREWAEQHHSKWVGQEGQTPLSRTDDNA